jgi:hypothetical protein
VSESKDEAALRREREATAEVNRRAAEKARQAAAERAEAERTRIERQRAEEARARKNDMPFNEGR